MKLYSAVTILYLPLSDIIINGETKSGVYKLFMGTYPCRHTRIEELMMCSDNIWTKISVDKTFSIQLDCPGKHKSNL